MRKQSTDRDKGKEVGEEGSSLVDDDDGETDVDDDEAEDEIEEDDDLCTSPAAEDEIEEDDDLCTSPAAEASSLKPCAVLRA